jgi:hypothetical protein
VEFSSRERSFEEEAIEPFPKNFRAAIFRQPVFFCRHRTILFPEFEFGRMISPGFGNFIQPVLYGRQRHQFSGGENIFVGDQQVITIVK